MGALELNLEPAELRGIVAEGLELLDPEARARIVIEPATLPSAIGEWDTPLLRRVFRNLCSNALKYSAADQQVRIVATVEDDAIHLSVIDEGIGLEPHEVERLFERYSRADGAKDRGIPGPASGCMRRAASSAPTAATSGWNPTAATRAQRHMSGCRSRGRRGSRRRASSSEPRTKTLPRRT